MALIQVTQYDFTNFSKPNTEEIGKNIDPITAEISQEKPKKFSLKISSKYLMIYENGTKTSNPIQFHEFFQT